MFSRSTADEDRSPGGKGYGAVGAGERMTVNDFHLLKIVGKGAFGKAMLSLSSFGITITTGTEIQTCIYVYWSFVLSYYLR